MTPTPQPKSRMEEKFNEIISDFILEFSVSFQKGNESDTVCACEGGAEMHVVKFLEKSMRSLIETYDRETEMERKGVWIKLQTGEDLVGHRYSDKEIEENNRALSFNDAIDAQSAAKAKWKGEK